MSYFGSFYLDKEKDIRVDLSKYWTTMTYVLRTPNHGTGNLITNLAKLCDLPLFTDENGLLVIEGKIPCYIDGNGNSIYIFRLGNTKIANIYPDGRIEMRAQIPSISKTLMSQTKDYRLDITKTIVKTFILEECKFRTDLHTHMNANLKPDILIALGIFHQIRYPLYYIKKLKLRITDEQREMLERQREGVAKVHADCGLTGKYLTRRIDDNTFINFADLILNNPVDAAYNIAKIRMSLAVLKDGQAVFTNLEKVYLYRYVFCKGVRASYAIPTENLEAISDPDILRLVLKMKEDKKTLHYRNNSLFQNKLLWIARSYQEQGVWYAEISDTTLVKRNGAAHMLAEVHEVMPHIFEETKVRIRFLAAIRRIPLTIVKDKASIGDYFWENLQVLEAVAKDPYVAGSDILGEEINDIRDISPVIREIVRVAGMDPYFVVRIHAGENDSLRDNVANSIQCVKDSLAAGQKMPSMRIGHGLYTANLNSPKGKALIQDIKDTGTVLEFQISSNVRLNNLSTLDNHPLRQYLKFGLDCVQGTDGGALYGTDSIDEQLSLEKLLALTYEDVCKMRDSERKVLGQGLLAFDVKTEAFYKECKEDVETFYQKKIDSLVKDNPVSMIGDARCMSEELFADRVEELPDDKKPVVIVGGSFNSDQHKTKINEKDCRIIDTLLKQADPEKIYFVVGHKMTGYEQYLVKKNQQEYHGRFRVYAFVPAKISSAEAKRLLESDVRIRISIEPIAMGLYKSVAYEVFKRRPSVLIAFDGNSAGVNMIQEAKNAKYKCRTFVNGRSRMLKTKADSLEGYVTLFGEETAEQAMKAIEKM